jgi:Uma2 family endonuclease
MSTPEAHRSISVEEYLALEATSAVRHEYVSGAVHALAGGSKRHALIVSNLVAWLRPAARGRGCRVYAADVKLRAASDVFYYPDVIVACGPDQGGALIETAPCLLVEVLSDSTAAIDRREKLHAYKQIPSLRSYLIVHQPDGRIERHWRDADGVWWTADLVKAGEIPLPEIDATLSLESAYEGVG